MATRTDTLFSREKLAGYDSRVLARGSVLVVGAGALAQNLLVNLALSGVGELRIVDFDSFEAHNAPRSPLFPDPEERKRLGMGKARVVAHKTLALAHADRPTVLYADEPVQALGAGAFEGVDAVAACVDNPEARAYLADMCRWLGVGLIEGGFNGSEVTFSSFPACSAAEAAEMPCYRCGNPALAGTFSCQRHAEAAVEAGVVPAIQAAAATLGGLQAEALVQALHGSFPTAGTRTNIDIRSGKYSRYELVTDPDCQGIHRRAGAATELTVTAADSVLSLYEAVQRDLGPGCSILLPDRFVRDAFCTDCGLPTVVDAPDWAWRAAPFCADCGGGFPRLSIAPEGYTPTIVPSIDLGLPQDLLQRPCAVLGISPRDVVEAELADRIEQYRLTGHLDDLFSKADL